MDGFYYYWDLLTVFRGVSEWARERLAMFICT